MLIVSLFEFVSVYESCESNCGSNWPLVSICFEAYFLYFFDAASSLFSMFCPFFCFFFKLSLPLWPLRTGSATDDGEVEDLSFLVVSASHECDLDDEEDFLLCRPRRPWEQPLSRPPLCSHCSASLG